MTAVTEFRVNSYTTNEQSYSAITTLTDGGFVVTWRSDGQDGSANGIFGQRYNSAGNKTGSEFQINTHTANEQAQPAISALNDGGFVVIWTSLGQDGSGFGVFAQRYSSTGAMVGNEFQINTHAINYQYQPSITTLANGGFVVAWTSLGQDGSGDGVYGQRYNSSGNKVGNEFQVNTYTANDQDISAITALLDGGFVVTWASLGQEGQDYGIFGQRYNSNGNKVGGEFQVNTHTIDSQYLPAITALLDGGFVVTWSSQGQDGSGSGIFGQRYNSTGNKAGTEFQINTNTAGDQSEPSITALTNGDFVVTWSSGTDIYAQRFSGNGNKVGGELLINSYTLSSQSQSSITALPDGGFIVTWTSFGQGDSLNIYARRFDRNNQDIIDTVITDESCVLPVASNNLILQGEGDINGTGNVLNNHIDGNNGHNTLDGLAGNDTIKGGAGNDTVSGGIGMDMLEGGSGNDSLVGGSEDDQLLAGDGDDILIGGLGNNMLDGGEGDDTAVYIDNWVDYTITRDAGQTITIKGSHGVDTLNNIENLKIKGVMLTIEQALNHKPVAQDDSGQINESTSTQTFDTVITGNVMVNDTDIDVPLGDNIKIVAIAGGRLGTAILGVYGSVVLNADGSYSYTLNNNDIDTDILATGEQGIDSFTYIVEDAHGAKSQAKLNIVVNGTTDPDVNAVKRPSYLFFANDGKHGTELWKTDGTAANTRLLKDINVSGNGVFDMPAYQLTSGEIVFFDTSNKLWISDGTEPGTYQITNNQFKFQRTIVDENFESHDEYYNPEYLELGNGTLLFTAVVNNEYGLWLTDGTTLGTRILAAVDPVVERVIEFDDEPYFYGRSGLSKLGDKFLFFTGNLNEFGASDIRDLWVSDGSSIERLLSGIGGFSNLGNGKALFSYTTAQYGEELWVTDGTATGTHILKDIIPGLSGSFPHYMRVVSTGRAIFFTYENNKTYLWSSDGTEAGTLMRTEVPSLNSNHIVKLGDRELIFSTIDGGQWITDGTVQGTHDVSNSPVDLVGGGGLTAAVGSIVLDDQRLLIVKESIVDKADGQYQESQLWVTDGTQEGTALLASGDSVPYYEESHYRIYLGKDHFKILPNGRFLVLLPGLKNGDHQLFVTDGTQAGTRFLNQLPSDIYEISQTTDDKVIFKGRDSAGGVELWYYDYQTETVGKLLEINQNTGDSRITLSRNYSVFLSSQNKILFSAEDGISGRELWTLNTQTNEVTLVKEIGAGSLSGLIAGSIQQINDQLCFFAQSGSLSLWISDGTQAGTQELLSSAGNQLQYYDNSLTLESKWLFVAKDKVTNDIGLWGLDTNTRQLVLLNSSASGGFTGLTQINSQQAIFFIGKDLFLTNGASQGTVKLKSFTSEPDLKVYTKLPSNKIIFTQGSQLWVTDGTVAGTVSLADNIPSFLTNTNWANVQLTGKTVLFATNAVWVTDGTVAGTQQIKTGVIVQQPAINLANGKILFNAYTAATGTELWVTDGSSAGTFLLKEINAQAAASYPVFISKVNNGKLFFTAEDNNGRELWVTDGTTQGTHLVKDINKNSDSGISGVTWLNENQFLFVANDGVSNRGLWVSDGTSAGTVLLRAGSTATGYVYVSSFSAVGAGKVLFQTLIPGKGSELWLTDGTAAGTMHLKGFSSLNFSSKIALPDGRFLFTANDGAHGTELWITDGTMAGTVLFKDIANTNQAQSSISTNLGNFFQTADGKIYFTLSDGTHGNELWTTDGTPEGTYLVQDINAQPSASSLNTTGGFYPTTPTTPPVLHQGSNVGEILTGGLGRQILEGFAGDDSLIGGSGEDTLIGGTGNDTYVTDGVADVLIEAANGGNDTIVTGTSYTLGANLENAVLAESAGLAGLTGNALNNKLAGNSSDNMLDGGSGNDTLEGGNGTDSLIGGLGNDIYKISQPGDVVIEQGGEGTDTVESMMDYVLADNVENLALFGPAAKMGTGNASANTITGTVGDNVLSGAAGDDTLIGGIGNDTLIGGIGNDVYEVNQAGDVVVEAEVVSAPGQAAAPADLDTVRSTVSYTLSDFVENLALIGNQNINGAGNSLANSLLGNTGNNVLTAQGGDDYLAGGGGRDTLVGGIGNDDYLVDSVDDVVIELAGQGLDIVRATVSYTLAGAVESLFLTGTAPLNGTGSEFDNLIVGNEVKNKLFGAAGNDTLDGGAGPDTLAGGTGNDIYKINGFGDVVIEAVSEGNDTVISEVNFTLSANIESLTLLGEAIKGTGNNSDNIIRANSNNNILDGQHGADTLIGRAGNDLYKVDDSADIIIEITGEGEDSVEASTSYTMAENLENLVLLGAAVQGTGNSLTNKLIGSQGNNILDGGKGVDTLIGGLGDDTYIFNDADNLIIEGADGGNDTVQTSFNHTLTANIENLVLMAGVIKGTGNTLANVITGNAANNILDGQAGADTLIGGIGNDLYRVANIGDTVLEQASAGNDTVESTINYILSANIENLGLFGPALRGTGNMSNNIIKGNALDNYLDGNAGADTLMGSLGDDVYVVDHLNDVVIERNNEGLDRIQTSVSYTASANIEHLSLTGTADINATGNRLDNLLKGNTGNNLLDGGLGADTLIGALGDDVYRVDANDVLVELESAGTDTVEANLDYVLKANIENLVLLGTAVAGSGNSLANLIQGNAADNLLDGQYGTDTLMGGLGNDTYSVDSLADMVIELEGEGIDTIKASISYILSGAMENLTLDGTGNLNATGSQIANTLAGNLGANVLNAEGGDDSLFGGAGKDVLIGGQGNDSLEGGEGVDVLQGGEGDDIYYVDNALDVIVELRNQGADTVFANVSYRLSDYLETLHLTGTSTLSGEGNAGANTLLGNSADNILTGGKGNDTLIGGLGNDVYIAGRGEGQDVIQENDLTALQLDYVLWQTGVGYDQLWFKHAGDNLEISVIGTSDKVVISDWYKGTAYQVEEFRIVDGSKVLLASEVEALVNAMAAVKAPVLGQTSLNSTQHTQLDAVLAANWS